MLKALFGHLIFFWCVHTLGTVFYFQFAFCLQYLPTTFFLFPGFVEVGRNCIIPVVKIARIRLELVCFRKL